MSNSAQRYSKTHRKGRQDKHQDREFRGIAQEVENAKSSNEKYNLAWFKPSGRQQDIVDAIDQYDWVGVQAPSGTGKTTTVVWKALSLLGKGYRKIVFVKNPTEVGTDMLGYLTGDKNDKMQAHFEAMRGVFLDFMNKGKLESDENNGKDAVFLPISRVLTPDGIRLSKNILTRRGGVQEERVKEKERCRIEFWEETFGGMKLTYMIFHLLLP